MGGSPISLWIYVEDADSLFNRAVAAGGRWRRDRWGRWRIGLGRPLRNVRRPGGPPLDDRDPQGGLDA
jgi:hypothetical protein